MAYTPITNEEIQVKQPVRQELMQKIKNNFDNHEGRLIAAGGAVGVPNGSFEIDSDNDGIPDSWTRNFYPGGTGGYETTNPAHGAKAYRFTHPGGAGNGGGYLESDYIEITEFISPVVEFYLRCSVAGMKNIVRLNYYNSAKVFISSEDIYTSTSNPTTWTRYRCIGVPPANARYVKIQLISGYTDTNVAGNIFWDGITIDPYPSKIPVSFTINVAYTSSAEFVDVASVSIRVPKGFSVLTFPATVYGNNASVEMRFRISTTYSNTQRAISGEANGAIYSISVSAFSGTQSLAMQLRVIEGTSVSGKKDQSIAEFVRY